MHVQDENMMNKYTASYKTDTLSLMFKVPVHKVRPQEDIASYQIFRSEYILLLSSNAAWQQVKKYTICKLLSMAQP